MKKNQYYLKIYKNIFIFIDYFKIIFENEIKENINNNKKKFIIINHELYFEKSYKYKIIKEFNLILILFNFL